MPRTCSSMSSAASGLPRPRPTSRSLPRSCSSLNGRPLPQDLVVFGELGLTGEIRPVPYGEERLREAAKHGFRRAIVPLANAPRQAIEGIAVAAVPKHRGRARRARLSSLLLRQDA